VYSGNDGWVLGGLNHRNILEATLESVRARSITLVIDDDIPIRMGLAAPIIGNTLRDGLFMRLIQTSSPGNKSLS